MKCTLCHEKDIKLKDFDFCNYCINALIQVFLDIYKKNLIANEFFEKFIAQLSTEKKEEMH